MQIFLTETKTKETLQKRRNLFGLGLTSLIAACGDKAAGGGGDTDTVPFEAAKAPSAVAASELSGTGEGKSEFTATLEDARSEFTVTITGGDNDPTLTFSDGAGHNKNAAKIYKLTTTKDQYDLVVSSPIIDKNEKIGTTDDNNPEYQKGGIFIFWNVAGIQDETIGGTSTSADNQRLEIKGAARDDQIGTYAPEFLKLGGEADNYDMVFSGPTVDRVSSASDTGAIYVLWDIADYAGATKTIDLGSITDATSGSLVIYGAHSDGYIVIYAPELLELGGADDAYDMVVRSHVVNDFKGAIYVLWDVTDYYDTEALHKTVTLDSSLADASNGAAYGLLSIYGAAVNDKIGSPAPELLQIGGTVNNYDMVFAVKGVDRVSGSPTNEGAIYVLWDIADYAGATKAIDLASITDATSGSLIIYGSTAGSYIGTYAPELLELGGADDAYDMVVRSDAVNGFKGAIYVLWDVTGYYDTEALHKTVTLDSSLADASNGATYGLLSIYGERANDKIGTYAPEFLQIAGKDDNYDMVIGSHFVDKTTAPDNTNEGAIYVLWDVADYAGQNKTIDIGNLADATGTSANVGATAGSLAIYGAQVNHLVGINAPDFLQIAGKDDNYDMVIRSHRVDKGSVDNTGAIYILWDVADYYSAATDKNKTIDFATPADATSGLLTIYGRGNNAKLGEKDDDNNINNNILYNADGELTNIDGDTDNGGTIDIALTDGMYTYIFFGDKIANDADGNDKVDSKTIDLATVNASLSDPAAAGFFSYDFDGVSGSAEAVERVGYRFADNAHTTLQDVQGAYTTANPSGLSDTDADLGVWDIA